jgi:hypothetical protein
MRIPISQLGQGVLLKRDLLEKNNLRDTYLQLVRKVLLKLLE